LFKVKADHILVDEGERVCLSGVDPHEWYDVHVSVVKKVACANLNIKPLLAVSSVPLGVGLTIYLDDLSNIGYHVATIGLQGNLAAVTYRFADISKSPGSDWVNAGEFDVLWVEETAGGWHEWPKGSSHLRMVLRDW
jgi:hypothetical protein